MNTLLTITEGWTKTLDAFTLKANGTPLPLTGLTVTLVLKDRNGDAADTSGDLTPDPDQGANPGVIRYKPDASDFAASKSPYTAKFQVVDGAGEIAFFPNGEADQIVVVKA